MPSVAISNEHCIDVVTINNNARNGAAIAIRVCLLDGDDFTVYQRRQCTARLVTSSLAIFWRIDFS